MTEFLQRYFLARTSVFPNNPECQPEQTLRGRDVQKIAENEYSNSQFLHKDIEQDSHNPKIAAFR